MHGTAHVLGTVVDVLPGVLGVLLLDTSIIIAGHTLPVTPPANDGVSWISTCLPGSICITNGQIDPSTRTGGTDYGFHQANSLMREQYMGLKRHSSW